MGLLKRVQTRIQIRLTFTYDPVDHAQSLYKWSVSLAPNENAKEIIYPNPSPPTPEGLGCEDRSLKAAIFAGPVATFLANVITYHAAPRFTTGPVS